MPLATKSGRTAMRSVVLPLLWRPTNAMRGAFTADRSGRERCPAARAELRAVGVRLPAARAVLAGARCRGGPGRGRCERLAVLLLRLVAEGADALAELAEHGRELPGPEDDEHDDEDEDELRSTQVERHGHFLVGAKCAGISTGVYESPGQPKRPSSSVRNSG